MELFGGVSLSASKDIRLLLGSNQIHVLRFPQQVIPELGMSDADDIQCPLSSGFPL
jgi:hypothetical protein